MALFQKTYEELRDAFVRNRFAEAAVFRRPDIEEWLHGEREAERPELERRPRGVHDPEVWNKLRQLGWTCDIALNASVSTLLERATPSDLPDFARGADAEQPIQWTNFMPFLRTLRTTRSAGHATASVYYGHEIGGIVLVKDADGTASEYLIREGSHRPGLMGEMSVEPFARNLAVTSETVVDVLFAEWLYGRPRWREARAFICDALAKQIADERKKAEADFDSAVAVSADGKQIIHADFVVVFDLARHAWRVLTAEYFRKHKLLRHHSMHRSSNVAGGREIVENPIASTESARQLHANLRQSLRYLEAPLQVFVDCWIERAKLYSVLISSPDLCPSPLPEGGVEVAV